MLIFVNQIWLKIFVDYAKTIVETENSESYLHENTKIWVANQFYLQRKPFKDRDKHKGTYINLNV